MRIRNSGSISIEEIVKGLEKENNKLELRSVFRVQTAKKLNSLLSKYKQTLKTSTQKQSLEELQRKQ